MQEFRFEGKELTFDELRELIKKSFIDLYCGRVPSDIESITDCYCTIFEGEFEDKRFYMSEAEIWNYIQDFESRGEL